MPNGPFTKALALTLSIALVMTPAASSQATFISTDSGLVQPQQHADYSRLTELLSTEQARAALLSMGVAPERVLERAQRLTPQELAQLNSQLERLPAGGSDILGVLVLLFIVFIVTDMLGATDIFPFVHPITKNKSGKD